MIKFWLASRPPATWTRERFDYEWSVIHTSLMVTTPSVMRTFSRYTQHRHIDEPVEGRTVVPSSPAEWYNISDHWLEDLGGLQSIFEGEDYPRRMQGHNFGDSAFVIELTTGKLVFDQPTPFTGRGGVKIVNFLRRRPDIEQEEFVDRWGGAHADRVVHEMTVEQDLLRRYMQNPQLPLDPSVFAGTLFEAGGVQTYAGIEELWFDDLDAALRLGDDQRLRTALTESYGEFADLESSFSMIVVERVVWDLTLPGPRPAILDDSSFETKMVAAERPNHSWRAILPPRER